MLSKKQKKFLEIDLPRMTIVEGCISSGKTYICNLKAIRHLVTSYKGEGLVFFIGKTLGTLKNNVLEPLMDIMPPGTFKYSLGNKEANLMGIKIHLEGCNDIRAENKIRGSTAEFIYGDELVLWNKEFLTRCLGSLRTPNAVFLGTTNPDRPDNFVKEDYLDRKKELEILNPHFYFEDNPSLTPRYIKQVEMEYTGVLHDRFIKGLWVTAQGLIYPTFTNHMDDYILQDKLEGEDRLIYKSIVSKYCEENRLTIKKVLIGIDWGPAGIGNAAVCTLILGGAKSNYEEILIVDEYMVDNREEDPAQLQIKLGEFIKTNVMKYGPANGYADFAVAILTTGLYNYCKANKIRCIVDDCVKHPIIERITLTNKLIAQNRIKILSRCENLVNSFKNAVWSDENKQDERLKETKQNNHNLIDAFEYSICYDMELLDTAGYLEEKI